MRRFVISAHFTHYDLAHLAVNIVAVALLTVAKLPELHGVRIFHVNEASVDD